MCRGKKCFCDSRLQYVLPDVAQYIRNHLSDTGRVTFCQRYDFLQLGRTISYEMQMLDSVIDVLLGCSGYVLHILYGIKQT